MLLHRQSWRWHSPGRWMWWVSVLSASMPLFPSVIMPVTLSFLSSQRYPLLLVNFISPIENSVKYSANLGVVTKLFYYLSRSLYEMKWSIVFMVRWPHELYCSRFVKLNWQFSFCTSQFTLSHLDLEAIRFIPSFLVHSLLFPDTLLGNLSCPVRFSCQISSLLSPPLK